MKTILLVKTSSLGDVVHNLPVASDIRAAFPDSRIDWVVEEAFAAVPRLHPAVEHVLPVAIRRWRRERCSPARRARRSARSWHDLRSRAYDAVVDTQGLLKSALIAFAARGARHGLDWASSREPLAVFYDRTYCVPWATARGGAQPRARCARAGLHGAARRRITAFAPPRASSDGFRAGPTRCCCMRPARSASCGPRRAGSSWDARSRGTRGAACCRGMETASARAASGSPGKSRARSCRPRSGWRR